MASKTATSSPNSRELILRKGTSSDSLSLLTLLTGMHGENWSSLKISLTKLHDKINSLMADPTAHCWVLLNQNNRIVGSVMLQKQSFFFSDDSFYGDWWTYIEPGARASNGFRKLISAARDHATKDGLPLIMGVFSTKDATRKNRLYKRQKLTPVGETFIYRPKA